MINYCLMLGTGIADDAGYVVDALRLVRPNLPEVTILSFIDALSATLNKYCLDAIHPLCYGGLLSETCKQLFLEEKRENVDRCSICQADKCGAKPFDDR